MPVTAPGPLQFLLLRTVNLAKEKKKKIFLKKLRPIQVPSTELCKVWDCIQDCVPRRVLFEAPGYSVIPEALGPAAMTTGHRCSPQVVSLGCYP